MYVSGEGSGKERRKARKEEEAQRKAAENANGEPKRHKIVNREKAKGEFAKQQVKDVIFAGGAALAISLYMATVGAPQAASALVLGIAAFAGKKVINAACRFGKKHVIKKRVKGNGKLKKGLILTASGILPVLVTGVPLTGILSLAIAATIMAKKAKGKCKTYDPEVEVDTEGKKRGKRRK